MRKTRTLPLPQPTPTILLRGSSLQGGSMVTAVLRGCVSEQPRPFSSRQLTDQPSPCGATDLAPFPPPRSDRPQQRKHARVSILARELICLPETHVLGVKS